MRIFKAIWAYLKDWKNLLTHGLIGAAILCAALFLPIKPFSRILILVRRDRLQPGQDAP
jgi:diacylglycerol kinase